MAIRDASAGNEMTIQKKGIGTTINQPKGAGSLRVDCRN